jgi:metal-dependent amidase/aminoacylase/carboxypeptidase family protein
LFFFSEEALDLEFTEKTLHNQNCIIITQEFIRFSMLYNIVMHDPSQKTDLIRYIDSHDDEIWEIAVYLFQHPETAFHEHMASEYLSERLLADGFLVENGIAGLETAFRGTIGESKPVIAILAEYDALPGLGHACGHNLIAASAIGAGLALNHLNNRPPGQVQIIGTPAEEGW